MATASRQPRTEMLCILYADIKDSTRLAVGARLEGCESAHNSRVLRFIQLWEHACSTHGSGICKSLGDGILSTFSNPHAALDSVIESFGTVLQEPECRGLCVRVGLHAGMVDVQENGDIIGSEAAFGHRVMHEAVGDQVLMSEAFVGLVRGYLPDGCSVRPLRARKLKGFPNPAGLFELVLPEVLSVAVGVESDHPQLPTLPVERSAFVGRKALVADIRRSVLEDEGRLVVLVGIGGVGKSRLALRIGHLLSRERAMYFVEVASLTRTEEVVPHLLGVLNIPVEPGADLLDALRDVVENEPSIIVLDNLEHLEGIEGVISAALNRCGSLRILATSRESLHLLNKTEFSLPPLIVPPEGASLLEISEAESVQLFVRRAKGVDREFQLNRENASAVAKICRMVGGIPLGIILAAQRIGLAEADEIASRLEYQLLDIKASDPDLPPRQQSLRAAFEWSYRNLGEQARSLLSRLIVFRGGFTVEAAEAVCGGAGVDDVHAELDTLRQHSWLDRVVVEGSRRWRLLEPVADFVREKAENVPDSISRAHAEYYLTLAHRIDGISRAREDSEGHRHMRRDMENFRTAFRWARNTGSHSIVASLGAALSSVMLEAGLWEEFTSWAEMSRASAERIGDAKVLTQVCSVQGKLASWRGQPEVALALHQEALQWADAAASDWAKMMAHFNLADTLLILGDMERCAYHAREIIRLAPIVHMDSDAGHGYLRLAVVAERDGRQADAERLWEQSREMFEVAGDTRSLGLWERERAKVREAAGDLQGALQYYISWLRTLNGLDLGQLAAQALGAIARVSFAADDAPRCVRCLSAARRLSRNYHAEHVINAVAQDLRRRLGDQPYRRAMIEADTIPRDKIIYDLFALTELEDEMFGETSTLPPCVVEIAEGSESNRDSGSSVTVRRKT